MWQKLEPDHISGINISALSFNQGFVASGFSTRKGLSIKENCSISRFNNKWEHKLISEVISMSPPNDTAAKTPILIVDDSRTVRAALSKVLSPYFAIIEAVDGEDGWKKLQVNAAIKLVVTDIMMPELDGYGLICRIRGAESDRLKLMPIIVVTSAEDEISRERAHACGANNFIVKPARPEDLLERVNFHTEAHLNGQPVTAPQMAQYESEIESAVIEAPTVEAALNILASEETGSLEPYAAELALKVLPLLEYCNDTFKLSADNDIGALKEKLQSI